MVPPQHPQLVSLCACQPRRCTCCRCASFRGRQTCCRNYRGAARHILPDRRGHEGLAAFRLVDSTVHRPHKVWCASALRTALRVCSSTCTHGLCCVCPLFVRVCVQPALLRGTAVPNRHYSGICINGAGPALLTALSVSRDFTGTIPGTALFNLHYYRGPSTVLGIIQYSSPVESVHRYKCSSAGVDYKVQVLGTRYGMHVTAVHQHTITCTRYQVQGNSSSGTQHTTAPYHRGRNLIVVWVSYEYLNHPYISVDNCKMCKKRQHQQRSYDGSKPVTPALRALVKAASCSTTPLAHFAAPKATLDQDMSTPSHAQAQRVLS